MHPFSEVELLLFFFPLFFFKFCQKFDYLRGRRLRTSFPFFLWNRFAKGNSSSSSVDWEPALAGGNEETVIGGIIFGSLRKNSASSSLNSHSFLSLPVLALCSLTFLNFSSNFFPFIATLFSCNSHRRVGVELLCNFIPCNFPSYCAIVEEVGFSRRREINNLVLFDDHVTRFSSFSSLVMK